MDRGAPRVGYSPQGHNESDTTERLNNKQPNQKSSNKGVGISIVPQFTSCWYFAMFVS